MNKPQQRNIRIMEKQDGSRDPYKDHNFPATEVKDMKMNKVRKSSKRRKRNENQIKVTFKEILNRHVL